LDGGTFPADLKSRSVVNHTSTKVTYAQTDAAGAGEAVRKNRSFEKYFDHVDTERTTTTVNVTCNAATGEYTITETRVYETSTTDPNRINNVVDFLSTERGQTIQHVVTSEGDGHYTTTTTNHGTKYLTDRI